MLKIAALIHVVSGYCDQPARAAPSLYGCAVLSQIGAEDGAGALPFNLDDPSTFC
jgi:hypothetical protein